MKKKIFRLIFILSLVFPTMIFSQDWSDARHSEAIVFTGYSLSRFVYTADSIKYFFLCSYREADNSWREITMQVDEIAENIGYFGKATDYNRTVDWDDEFVFMAQDAGDYAPPSSWIDNEDSRKYVRHQFEINNPEQPTLKRYVYLFRSATLSHDPSLPKSYISYISPASGASDTVKALSYLEGHNAKGIPDVWRVADSSGKFGPDFLDRQKARANGKYKWYVISVDYKLTENDLVVSKVQYKQGPIRIIRDISYKTQFSGLDVTIGTFRYRFYPNRIVSLGADRTLESDYGVKLIRQSFDLDSTAIGMKFHNADNVNIMIDGVKDAVNTALYPPPAINWHMYSGDPGTVVMINQFTPPASSIYNFYYQESRTGETADGTKETGDNRSYGDAGILMQAPEGGKIIGAISLPYTTYFLPGQRPPEIGTALTHPITYIEAVDNFAAPAHIAIGIADTSSPALYPVSIPVQIGNATGLNITSCRLAIHFDSKILEATGVSLANTLAQNWNEPAFSIIADTLTIELRGTEALKDSGALVYLNFDVIGAADQQSPLQLTQVKFNSWNPIANIQNGIFTARATPEVTVKIPSTTGAPKSEVLIPIQVDNVTGLKIQRFVLEVQFSKYVLDALSVVTDGTITAGWTDIVFADQISSARIELSGAAPLQGSGTLLKIKFKVIGSAGQSTDITFRNVVFNDGVPFDRMINGKFAITSPSVIDVAVAIPDTTIESLSVIRLPVSVTGVAGYRLSGYQMDLKYDDRILAYLGFDQAATIASTWNPPVATLKSGMLSIFAEGDHPLPGDGTLIYLDFKVVGADSSFTTIHFNTMTFNSGTYVPGVKDGRIEVRGVVPVELSAFSAQVINNAVHLQWATATEMNNYGFFVQKSETRGSDWQTIAFIPGKGTTSVPQYYEFVDSDVKPGTWYYRLKQQDIDGTICYSHPLAASVSVPTKFALLQNYPNPFNEATIIRYDLASGEHDVKIIIFDLLGQQIKVLVNERQPGGSYQIAWDGRDDLGRPAPTGIYFYHWHVGQLTHVKKMVLIE